MVHQHRLGFDIKLSRRLLGLSGKERKMVHFPTDLDRGDSSDKVSNAYNPISVAVTRDGVAARTISV